MKKIVFGLYDQLKNKSASYREHVRDITMFSVNVAVRSYGAESQTNPTLIESTSVEDIIKKAAETDNEYLYIVAMGYTAFDHKLAQRAIEDAEAGNYAIIGHILEDKPTGFYQLHPQCLLVNLNAWRQHCAVYGGFETVSNVELPVPERSPMDIHDDYTPTYLKPTGQTVNYSGPLKEGWNLIASLLKAGCAVGNFSNDIRRFKSHMYPEMSDDRFERILAGDNSITLEENGPTYGQYQYLKDTDFAMFKNSVFVFNNDSMRIDNIAYSKSTKLGTLYAVAAGFKPIQLLTQTDFGSARVAYIDYSQPALDFKRWLWETWDGEDYIKAIKDYKNMNPSFDANWLFEKDYTPEWDKTIEVFGGRDAWKAIWAQYKKTPHVFIKTNLFGEYSEMLADMKSNQGNNIIWYSNSFYTPASIRNFSPQTLDGLYKQFVNDVKQANISIQFAGCDNKCDYHWKHYGTIQ
jgi:hypothetical protein